MIGSDTTVVVLLLVTNPRQLMYILQSAWQRTFNLSVSLLICKGQFQLDGTYVNGDTSTPRTAANAMHRSFGGTISSGICEHLEESYLSGIIHLGGFPYFSASKEVGTNLMGSTFQTFANPDASASELAEAIVLLVDSCITDGYEISTEQKWLWRGIILSQVYSYPPPILHDCSSASAARSRTLSYSK